MIQDDILEITSPDSIAFLLVLIAHTEAHKPYDEVAGLDICCETFDADAVSGSSLSCNGDVTLGYVQLGLQVYQSCHIEYNRSCAGLIQGITQRSFS